MNIKENYYDVVIAGQGAAAFAAGLYAARYQIKSLIIGETFGGETATGGLIENYPGYPEIDGLDLMLKFKEQVVKYDVPIIDDKVDITINPSELRIDTYRASGAGGQHVNRTDSAVRITHQSSGIVVQCQSQRSQHQNRETAMKMLRSRLYEQEMEKRRNEQQAIESQKSEIGFGSQIRSYILHPYKMVKDHRTKYETANVDKVMDGSIDMFIRSYLLYQMENNNE